MDGNGIPAASDGGESGATARRAAVATLREAMKRETRLSVAFLGAALFGIAVAAALCTPFAHQLMIRLSDPEEGGLTGAPGERSIMFLFCAAFFVGALFLVERRRRVAFDGATTEDPALRALAADRSRAAGTHAPNRVCAAIEGGVIVEDRLGAFSNRVERVLVVSAAYLPRSAEGDLVQAIDDQLLAVSGTGRAAASARARAAFLATSLTNWTSPQSSDAPGYSLLFRALEVVGRAPLWVSTLPFRAALLGAIAERQRATAAVGVVDAGARRSTRGRTRRDEKVAKYVRGVLHPLTSVGLFLSDPLVGFAREQSRESAEDDVPSTAGARSGAVDALANAYLATLDHVVAGDLQTQTCAAVASGQLERTIVAHAKRVATRLEVRRKKSAGARKAFIALVDALSRGEGPAAIGRVQPTVLSDASVLAGLRYNHALSRALQSTLAAALLESGGTIVDPFAAQTIAVQLEGERIDVFGIVSEALSKASGAAALDAWADRLRATVAPKHAEVVPGDDERSSRAIDTNEEGPSHAEVVTAAHPGDGDIVSAAVATGGAVREAPRAARAALKDANDRITRSALYLLIGFALTSLLAVPVGYAAVLGLHAAITADDDAPRPLATGTTWMLATLVVGVAVVAASARLPHRAAIDLDPSRRLQRLVEEAAARHATHAPGIFEVVEDRADLPQVELLDHAEWLVGGVDRQLFVSEALTGEAEAAELEEQLDLAFAAVSGTNILAASLRGRANCLRAMDGQVRGLPDDPSQWWVLLAIVRASSFVLAKPARAAVAGFDGRARERLTVAIAAYRARRVA